MIDRLMAWLRTLPQRFLNWWEKFTKRQKITIIGLTVAVVAAIVVLVATVNRPQYVKIYTASSEKDAKEVLDMLASNSYTYITDDSGLVISVLKKDYTQANLLLGSSGVYVDAYGIENVTDGGFTTTEADKRRKWKVYLQKYFEEQLSVYEFVRRAHVTIDVPEDNGTLIAQNKEASAVVILELKDRDACTQEVAAGIGRMLATAIGNSTTSKIVIMDSAGKMLFSGADESTTMGVASSTYALQDQVSNSIRNQVKQMLAATNEFSSIEVAANIVLDNAYSEYNEHLYWPDTGKDQGVLASRDTYEESSTGSIAGLPGTDSNLETGYQYRDTENNSAEVKEVAEKFLPNESTLSKQIPAGAIKKDESSITVTLLTYDILREEDAKRQGLLDGTTWNEYKLANNTRTKLEVDEDIYKAVSTATGIATNAITIISYQEPYFIDKEGFSIETADFLQIILIILILGLLAFVIIRSMRSAKTEEEEAEINIDEILQSTPMEELEEIGFEDKSEARRIVEKFVEDNPDAAANLLRNWLNEDWE